MLGDTLMVDHTDTKSAWNLARFSVDRGGLTDVRRAQQSVFLHIGLIVWARCSPSLGIATQGDHHVA